MLIAKLFWDKGIVEHAEATKIVKHCHPQTAFRLAGPFYHNLTALPESELEEWQREGLIDYLDSMSDARPANCGR